MKYEIDMLSVGNADAILIKYLKEEEEILILVDSGREKDSKKIIKHIKEHTKGYIDLAISTHPDNDHIGGFKDIVNEIKIIKFWIHDPMKHPLTSKIINESKNSTSRLENLLYESLKDSITLIELLDKKQIKRDEPFAKLEFEHAPLKVVGPSKEYYEKLLVRFRDIKTLKEDLDLKNDEFIMEESIANKQMNFSLQQSLNIKDDKSKVNNSSVILLFQTDRKYLFTSDSCPESLLLANNTFNIDKLYWLDVPHHGSRYNLSTEVLEIFKPTYAYISCNGKSGYPSEEVVAELKRIGCEVYSTGNGHNLLKRRNTPSREGYKRATHL